MIVHIVMFKFNENNKEKNIQEAKKQLESLLNKIPSLLTMEVGVNFDNADRAFNLSIYTTFEHTKALQEYATHSLHLEVVSFIKKVTTKSHVVDYEK